MKSKIARHRKHIGKQGQQALGIGSIISFVLIFAVATIAIALTSKVLSEVKNEVNDDNMNNSAAYNATSDGLETMTTFSGWFPTLALVVVAGIIITIVVVVLYRRFAG